MVWFPRMTVDPCSVCRRALYWYTFLTCVCLCWYNVIFATCLCWLWWFYWPVCECCYTDFTEMCVCAVVLWFYGLVLPLWFCGFVYLCVCFALPFYGRLYVCSSSYGLSDHAAILICMCLICMDWQLELQPALDCLLDTCYWLLHPALCGADCRVQRWQQQTNDWCQVPVFMLHRSAPSYKCSCLFVQCPLCELLALFAPVVKWPGLKLCFHGKHS